MPEYHVPLRVVIYLDATVQAESEADATKKALDGDVCAKRLRRATWVDAEVRGRITEIHTPGPD